MILLTTVHNKNGDLKEEIEANADHIKRMFSEVYICISDQTSIKTIQTLQITFNKCKVIPKKGAADARRSVVKYVLEDNSNDQKYLYCDFDRLITWIEIAKHELENVIKKTSNMQLDYLIIGRTKKAFQTHPSSWIETEKITNKISELYFGLKEVDITAGSAIMNTVAAKTIAKDSDYGYSDCEWPFLIKKTDGKIDHIKVDGLAYEKRNQEIEKNEIKSYYVRLKLAQNLTKIFFE